MVAPLAIISLISTASDVISGISNLVSAASGPSSGSGNSGSSIFSNLVNSAESGSSLNSQSSLEVTPQGSAPQLTAQGAAIIRADSTQEAITNQTIDAINNILSGKGTPADITTLNNAGNSNVQPLAESDGNDNVEDSSDNTDSGNKASLFGNTRLDDPLGIKAAQANAAQIAAPLVVPADSNLNVPVVDLGQNVKSASQDPNSVQVNSDIIKQSDNNVPLQFNATADKSGGKEKIFKITDADSKAAQNAQDQNNSNILKTNDAAQLAGKQVAGNNNNNAGAANNNAAPGLADGQDGNSPLNNPANVGILANGLDPKTIGEAVRAIKAKEDIKDKLSTIDTYKIVSVSKKDNIIDLRLEPSQLGKVQIKLDFSDGGKANIMVTADRPETLNLLQRDTRSIQKILTDNGVNVDSSSLSFDLSSQQQQQQHNNFNFFSGRPLSFRVQEQVSGMVAANNTANDSGYASYNGSAANGMLNIVV
jgi:flagellar hook-length control protein FliK